MGGALALCPHELLALAFSREELIRLWHSCIFASKLDDYFEEHEALVWKVRHALWSYGGSRDYQRFVACSNGLGRLAIAWLQGALIGRKRCRGKRFSAGCLTELGRT